MSKGMGMNIQVSEKWKNALEEVGIKIDGNVIDLCGKKRMFVSTVREVAGLGGETGNTETIYTLFVFAVEERGGLLFEFRARNNISVKEDEGKFTNTCTNTCWIVYGSNTVKDMTAFIEQNKFVSGGSSGEARWGDMFMFINKDRERGLNVVPETRANKNVEEWLDEVFRSAKQFFDKKSENAWKEMMNKKKEKDNNE